MVLGSSSLDSFALFLCLAITHQLASIHLPRIGADMKDINYYSVEKLVQNILAGNGLDVNMCVNLAFFYLSIY